jgi:hypothetical protein
VKLLDVVTEGIFARLTLINSASPSWGDSVPYAWLSIESAAFNRDLELAMIDVGRLHAVVFPCRRVLGGPGQRSHRSRVNIHPTHWREWDRSGVTGPRLRSI